MADLLPKEAVCSRCAGRGWILEADGTAGTARPCSCQFENLTPRLMEGAHIPSRYHSCSFKSFDINAPSAAAKDQLLQAKTLSERYVDRFLGEDGVFAETGLIFVGPPGVGKTHLAVAGFKELISRYKLGNRGL